MVSTSLSATPPQTASRVAPAFRRLPPPVILIGMHRSGTSMVAAMLSALGVYVDPDWSDYTSDAMRPPNAAQRTGGYAEAETFRLLNEYILAHAGATWDNPAPLLEAQRDARFVRANCNLLSAATWGSLHTGYYRRRPDTFQGHWGWKDPRNSLTLPLWLQLFPNAFLLHVRRDPQAIVRSVVKRASIAAPAPTSKSPLHFLRTHPELTARFVRRRLNLGFRPRTDPTRLRDQDYCLDLCRLYTEECERYRYGSNPYLELAFEDIVSDPEEGVRQITQFVGLETTSAQWRQAIQMVEKPADLSPFPERRTNSAEKAGDVIG